MDGSGPARFGLTTPPISSTAMDALEDTDTRLVAMETTSRSLRDGPSCRQSSISAARPAGRPVRRAALTSGTASARWAPAAQMKRVTRAVQPRENRKSMSSLKSAQRAARLRSKVISKDEDGAQSCCWTDGDTRGRTLSGDGQDTVRRSATPESEPEPGRVGTGHESLRVPDLPENVAMATMGQTPRETLLQVLHQFLQNRDRTGSVPGHGGSGCRRVSMGSGSAAGQ